MTKDNTAVEIFIAKIVVTSAYPSAFVETYFARCSPMHIGGAPLVGRKLLPVEEFHGCETTTILTVRSSQTANELHVRQVSSEQSDCSTLHGKKVFFL